jgi:hypothetical protein|tara:strand:- start:471 stop:716 length:246 start_codon:yes stop_codon:yes gene_type:complete
MWNDLYSSIFEKDEHKKSREYRKQSPKMKKAIDDLFKKLDSKGSNFLNNFERTIKDVARKNRVPEKKIMDYFEKEATAFMQ